MEEILKSHTEEVLESGMCRAAILPQIPYPFTRHFGPARGTMPVPEFTSTETNSPIVEKKTPVITREILQSYLLCKVKGHLKLMGETAGPAHTNILMR